MKQFITRGPTQAMKISFIGLKGGEIIQKAHKKQSVNKQIKNMRISFPAKAILKSITIANSP